MIVDNDLELQSVNNLWKGNGVKPGTFIVQRKCLDGHQADEIYAHI